MTEKEKMLSGLPYDASDAELEEERTRIRELVYDYNLTREREREKRAELLDKMLFHGKNTTICPPVRFDYGSNTKVGDNFFSNFNLTVLDCANVTVGNDVYIGPNVTLATPLHDLDPDRRRGRYKEDGTFYDVESALPIVIGNDVWIASSVTICGGVTVGDGAVIGAGSGVLHDVPPYTLVAGNPARVIRKIKTENERGKEE